MFKNFKNLSLLQLFFIIIYTPVILALMIVIAVNFKHSQDIFNKYNQELNTYISDEIENIIEFQDIAFKNLDSKLDSYLRKKSQGIVDRYTSGEFDPETDNILELQQEVGLKSGIEDIYIVNNNGVVISTTFAKDLNLNLFTFGQDHKDFLMDVFNSRTYRSDAITIEASTKRLKKYTYQATPDGKYIVELGSYCQEAEEVLNFVERRMDEIEIKYENIYSIGLFLKADQPFTFSNNRRPEDFNRNLLNMTFEKKKNILLTIDTLDTELMFSFNYIKRENTSLYDEAVIAIISDLQYKKSFIKDEILYYLLLFLFISIVLVIILRISFRQYITLPLKKAIKLLGKLANGEIPDIRTQDNHNKNNEIGKLLFSLRKLIKNLHRSVKFAKEIEQGNLKANIEISGNKDELGHSLEKMKQGLLKKQKEEKEKQEAEEIRKWQMQGLANFNDIISKHRGAMKSLCDKIIGELIDYIDIQVGAIYLSDSSNKEETVLELISSYAYDRHKFLEKQLLLGEGLIGTCAIEQEMMSLKDIPNNYITIGSGVGSARPKHLVIIPIVMDAKTLGVIELASFETITPQKIDFINKMVENFGGALLKTRLNIEADILREKYEEQQHQLNEIKKEKQILNDWVQNAKLSEKYKNSDN